MPYKILIADRVDVYLEKLDKSERERVIKRLRLLEENPILLVSPGEPSGS